MPSIFLDQNDPRIIDIARSRQGLVRSWLVENNLDGVVISRRDQFSWLTSGGDNRVLHNSDLGFAHAVITAKNQYIVAHSMDAARILEEQVYGQGYELISLHWYDGDPREAALKLAGAHVAADAPGLGVENVHSALSYLHTPLSEIDIERSNWLAEQVDQVLFDLARTVQPGESEEEVSRRLYADLVMRGIEPDVLIVASDERIFRYRHPLPTHKEINKYLLLHPAARRWGLHANISRSLHFGDPSQEIFQAYHAVATIEARIISMLKEGILFADIFTQQKIWYAQLGFADEWRNHFQGGPTGYVVVDVGQNQTSASLQVNQAFDWFITVTGAKVEELILLTSAGVRIASYQSSWPGLNISTDSGTVIVPGLWVM